MKKKNDSVKKKYNYRIEILKRECDFVSLSTGDVHTDGLDETFTPLSGRQSREIAPLNRIQTISCKEYRLRFRQPTNFCSHFTICHNNNIRH